MTTKEFITTKLLHSNFYDTLATTAMATDSVTPSLSTFLGTGLDAHIASQSLSDFRRGGVARVGEFNLERAFSEKFNFKTPSQGCLSSSLQFKNMTIRSSYYCL